MRENRTYGSEGGEPGSTGLPYPYYAVAASRLSWVFWAYTLAASRLNWVFRAYTPGLRVRLADNKQPTAAKRRQESLTPGIVAGGNRCRR